MGIKVISKGNWDKTMNFLKRKREAKLRATLEKYGKEGVEALERYTPKRTGLTAASWYYEVKKTDKGYELNFNNSNLAEPGMPVAILIQFGHGTQSGQYVRGIDYINPALEPVFRRMGYEIWKEVKD